MQHNDLNIVTVSRVLNLINGGMPVFSSCVRTHTETKMSPLLAICYTTKIENASNTLQMERNTRSNF